MEDFIKEFNEFWNNDTIANQESIFGTGIEDNSYNIRMILKDEKKSFVKLNYILSMIQCNNLKYNLEFIFFDNAEHKRLVNIKVF